MISLNEIATWIALIGCPIGIGGFIDLFVKDEVKRAAQLKLTNLYTTTSRPAAIYISGIIVSIATGILCIHVAGFSQKVSLLGGWRTAIESAAPIALSLILKALILDPVLFFGTGRFDSAIRGQDKAGRTLPTLARWGALSLFLLGAFWLTRITISAGEELQENGLRYIFPQTNQTSSSVADAGRKSPSAEEKRPNNLTEFKTPQAEAVIQPKKFNITDLLHSFSLVIADYYSNAFLFLNGATCFLILKLFIRTAEWISEHINKDVFPKYIFTALSLVIAIVLTALLIGYHIIEER